jgi:hypothetical protein
MIWKAAIKVAKASRKVDRRASWQYHVSLSSKVSGGK